MHHPDSSVHPGDAAPDRPMDAAVDRPTPPPDAAADHAPAPDAAHGDGGTLHDASTADGPPACTTHAIYSPADSAAFFPYEVGARWRFQVTGTTDSDPTFQPSTFLQERQVTGTHMVGTATALVVRSSNTVESDGPLQEYLAVTADGLVSYGNDGLRSTDNFSAFVSPYTAVPFPLDGCATGMPFDRRGVDSGSDLDGDGINELIDLQGTSVFRVESVTVPIGAFPNAVRVETTVQSTLTYSKSGHHATSSRRQVDWYGSGVGPVRRLVSNGARTYAYDLIAYSVRGVSRGVLPAGALARNLPQASSNPYTPNRPTIGFDGTHFLVVVPTSTPAPPFYNGNLQPFVVAPNAAPQMGAPLLAQGYAVTGVVTAFNGTEHMLAFNHNDAQTVEALAVATDGTALGSPVVVSNSAGGSSAWPAIVATANGFLVSYLKYSTGSGTTARQTSLWMVPVDAHGAPGTAVQAFPTIAPAQAVLATDGSTILGLWSAYGTVLMAARFDAAGHPLDTNPVLVSTAQADSASDLQLIFDGTQFVALWKSNRTTFGGTSTRVARIGKDLKLLDGPAAAGGATVGSNGTVRTTPRIGRVGSGSLVIWDPHSYTPALTGVAVARFTPSGQVLDTAGTPDGILALGPGGTAPFSQSPLPEIFWGGDRALLVWTSPPADPQGQAFNLDYGYAYPWDGPGIGGSGGATGTGGAGGAGGMGGAGGQAVVCGFPMPNPASAHLPNPASYDTSTAGLVVDKVTGLTWQQPAGGSAAAGCTLDSGGLQLCPEASAAALCSADRTGGFADWRLPTVPELFSLTDYTASAPTIDHTTFPGTPPAAFWTSTLVPTTTLQGWTVNFQQGNYQLTRTQDSHNVRCVRGSPPASRCYPSNARYQVANDMATDQITGLTWQSYGGPPGLMWSDAGAYCALLGMRLPSVKEAVSILDFTQSSSTGSLVDRTAFLKLGFDWTSSVILGQYMSAWSVDLDDGTMGIDTYSGNATSTRCVR